MIERLAGVEARPRRPAGRECRHAGTGRLLWVILQRGKGYQNPRMRNDADRGTSGETIHLRFLHACKNRRLQGKYDWRVLCRKTSQILRERRPSLEGTHRRGRDYTVVSTLPARHPMEPAQLQTVLSVLSVPLYQRITLLPIHHVCLLPRYAVIYTSGRVCWARVVSVKYWKRKKLANFLPRVTWRAEVTVLWVIWKCISTSNEIWLPRIRPLPTILL